MTGRLMSARLEYRDDRANRLVSTDDAGAERASEWRDYSDDPAAVARATGLEVPERRPAPGRSHQGGSR